MSQSKKLGLALALAAGCGGGGGQLVAREGSVHDALTGLGFASSGARSEASLDEGGTMQFPLRLERGECRAFVALGSNGIQDLTIDVLRADGMRVARDESHGRDATATFCASASAEVEVVVTAARGHGEVVVSMYDTAGRGPRSAGGGDGFASNCSTAEAIELGASITGSTAGARHTNDGSCFSGNSPEVYYQLSVAVASMVTLDLTSDYDGALYVLRECGSGQELGCNDDYDSDRRRSHLELEMQPGTYVVVVDGYGQESGNFELSVRGEPLVPLADLCSAAPVLVAGTAHQGSTATTLDRFQASCAASGRGHDQVHRLDLAAASRVRLLQNTPNYDGALFVRRQCEVESSEVACNDDWDGIDKSVITTRLDAGTYFVYSDAYASGEGASSGAYTLQADVVAADGTGGPSDTCANDVEPISGNTTVTLDTFTARDDYQGSCGGQGGADLVRRIRVAARSSLRVTLGDSQFHGVAYLRRATCDGAEVACRAFEAAVRSDAKTDLDAVVDPGEYVLVIDGADLEAFGSVSVQVTLTDLAAVERMCRDAPALTSGRDVSGTTVGRSNGFEATCASAATSPDQLYRLVLRRRSFVSVRMESGAGFDGVLHMRRGDCGAIASEVACNDDFGDTQHSLIEGNFDAGTYYVIVDGYSSSNSGTYRIRADVSAERPGFTPAAPPTTGPGVPERGLEIKPVGRSFKASALR